MKKIKEALIFDGDDTLWDIQSFYDDAKDAFYELMERQGFDRDLVRAKLAEIDRSNMSKYGFSRVRFPQSMQDTYAYFCSDCNIPEDLSVLEQTVTIGASVFERKPVLAPGARQVLSTLRRTHILILYSVGDPEVQWKKVRDLSLEPSFNAIYITERKDHHQMQRILDEQHLHPEATWMVGNSLRSDINPALRLGLRCIWVHANTWDYDHEELLPGRVWSVKDLREIPAILSEIEATTRQSIR